MMHATCVAEIFKPHLVLHVSLALPQSEYNRLVLDEIPESNGPGITPRASSGDGGNNGDLQTSENQLKLQRELEKLQLEIDSLLRKQSPWGRILENLGVVGPIVSTLTLALAIFGAGYQLYKQGLDTESGRFQQAYSKLGSQLRPERSSGVAELSHLLGEDAGKLDGEVLINLVNSLALDESAEVRSGIVNVFDHLKGRINNSALDAALKSTISLQRTAIRLSGLAPFELATLHFDKKKALVYSPLPEDYGTQDGIVLAQVPSSQRSTVESLFDLSRVLMDLLAAGGAEKDLNGIFCPGCNFANSKFNDVDFENAVLVDTVWQFAELEHANFNHALLERADFTGAHLRGAMFGQDEHDTNRRKFVEISQYLQFANFSPHENDALTKNINEDNATFACSDLRDSTFNYFAIMARTDESIPSDYALSVYFLGANIQGSDFTRVRETVVLPGTKKMPSGRFYATDKVRFANGLVSVYDSDVEDAPLVRPDSGSRDIEGVAALLDLAENVNEAKLAGRKTTLKMIGQRRLAKQLEPNCQEISKRYRAEPFISRAIPAHDFLREKEKLH